MNSFNLISPYANHEVRLLKSKELVLSEEPSLLK